MITISPLPFLPEPLEQLQARYPRALLKRWDFRTCPPGAANLPPFDRPQLHREHVFDLGPAGQGVRLVIARVYRALPTLHPATPRDWIHVAFACLSRRMELDDLVLLSEIHLDRITRGQLVVAAQRIVTSSGTADLFFLPPSTSPAGSMLDHFPGREIRVCL